MDAPSHLNTASELANNGPLLVLVQPQMGENIGAAARAMANFGLSDLAIVAPRDGWPNDKAYQMSAGATWPLDDAHVCATTDEACAKAQVIYATSGAPRALDRPVMTPRAAMADMRARIATGQHCAILFGPERSGLLEQDLARADIIITCPTDARFPSLNLAQAVGVMAYEWAASASDNLPEGWRAPIDNPAPKASFEALLAALATGLDDAHFFWPLEKRASMLQLLRTAFLRAQLTLNEVNLLQGAFKHLTSGPRRRASEPILALNGDLALNQARRIWPDATNVQALAIGPRGAFVVAETGAIAQGLFVTIEAGVVTATKLFTPTD